MIQDSPRLKLAVLVLISGIIIFAYWTMEPRLLSLKPTFYLKDQEILLEMVYDLQSILRQKYKMSTNANRQINKIISFLEAANPNSSKKKQFQKKNSSDEKHSSILEVCPEIWLGTKSDYPFYYQGWKILDCAKVLPFEEVLTIVLYYPANKNKTCSPNLQKVLSGLKKLYPKVPLVVGIPGDCLAVKDSPNIHLVNISGNEPTPGIIWNMLIKTATTPYVLVGRDLEDFIWTTNLEREVRMLSYNRNISVAGGSVRNLTGHWRVGCYQTSMKNYILEYMEGYYASRNECMFCDHLFGPFVTRTKLLQSFPFDESLPGEVLFEDWFWRIRKESNVVVNCPDVMYLASDPVASSKMENKSLWVSLVRKWELNRVVMPNGRVFSYSCAEASISCKNAAEDTQYFLMPICCIEQFASAFKAFDDFCRTNNLRYELDTGSVLGAMKMNGLMPWDVDADISYYVSNHTVFSSNKEFFMKRNITVTEFSREKGSSYFLIRTPDISVEMWGISKLSHDNSTFGEPFRLIPTQVLYHGYWVYAPHSPATFSRGRYGHETLKHAHSWRHLGLKNSQQVYEAGSFNKCKKPGHHACLDQFSADGNLQFRVPN